MFHSFGNVVRSEGIRGLFKGVSPSLARELTYSSVCLASYEPYKNLLGASDPHSPFYLQVAAGSLAGMTGATPFTPTDLLKVRM